MQALNKIPKVFLIILDGFGIGKDYPFNAIQNAKMPFYKLLDKKYPKSKLLTCGEAVGLPNGIMGNSEVGHTNIGAGRIVYQELTRIQKAIEDGEFQKNAILVDAIKNTNGQFHLMGLLSDAGVHSHLDHLKALIQVLAHKQPVTIHVFTDGRDTPPGSAIHYLKELGEFLRHYPQAVVGSICGRYYAMDRDSRWDRIEKAYRVMTGQCGFYPYQKGNGVGAALKFLEESYSKQITDEFIEPTAFNPQNLFSQSHLNVSVSRNSIQEGDSVLFFNFRADRARELTSAFTEENFTHFKREKFLKLQKFICMTQYNKNLSLPALFYPQKLNLIFSDILSTKNLNQFRIAETEKYAHITYFFNGGREQAYKNEERVLIPSPKEVPTYDLKPQMSAREVTDVLVQKLAASHSHFVLVNFANPDMVGHTGNYEAATKALQTVDECLEKCVCAAKKAGYEIFITADHGNIEEMQDGEGNPHTQHTLNPVPFHYISSSGFQYQLQDGILADIAPTFLEVMGLPKPIEMTGHSLLEGSRSGGFAAGARDRE